MLSKSLRKGIVSDFQVSLHAKMAMPWTQHNLFSIISVEDIVVFQGLQMFYFDNFLYIFGSRNAQVFSIEKPQLKIISFQYIYT